MLYDLTHAIAVNVVESVLGHSFLACNLLWPCSLTETSDTQLGGIHWSRKISYLKSRVSGKKQRRWRNTTLRARAIVLLRNQLINYPIRAHINIYIYIYIYIGKRTEWSPIRSVIIRVITKSVDRKAVTLIEIRISYAARVFGATSDRDLALRTSRDSARCYATKRSERQNRE